MPRLFLPKPMPGLTRRTALVSSVVGAGVLVTGCTTDGAPQPAPGRRRGDADNATGQEPDVALAAMAVAGERSALAAVTHTIERHADLEAVLSPVLLAHRAHVSLLADAAPDEAGSEAASPTTGASPSPDDAGSEAATSTTGASPRPDEPTGTTDRPPVPARSNAALHRLSLLEQDLSLANKRHAFAAESGAFARLLASMAASAAQHASVLEAASATGPAGR